MVEPYRCHETIAQCNGAPGRRTGPDAPARAYYLAGLNAAVAAVEGQIAKLTPSWI
jgi:hypothetical protein